MATTYDGFEAATTLTGTETTTMVQSGKLVKTTLQDIADLGGGFYKVYTASITQLGTNAPVATVFQNTLGGTVVWTREEEGRYRGTLAGAFTVNKTTHPSGILNVEDGSGWTCENSLVDHVNLYTGTFGVGYADGLIQVPIFFEIRVYP